MEKNGEINVFDIYGFVNAKGRTREVSPITNSHRQVIDAVRYWIKKHGFVKTPRVRRGTDSYKFKHVMEHTAGLYALNGLFIQAMIEEGFNAKQNAANSPNANFNIDKKQIPKWDYATFAPPLSAKEFLEEAQ